MRDTPAPVTPVAAAAPSAPCEQASVQWLRLQLHSSPPHACSYLPDQEARLQILAPLDALPPPHTLGSAAYAQLIDRGFRRSGLTIYRPHCAHCAHCLPLRVPTATFAPTRSQRRALQQHQHLQVRLLPLAFQADHYALYQHYQQQRHSDGAVSPAEPVTERDYRDFILSSPVDSFLAEFRDPAGALKIVALTDYLPQALSAVYTFYAPEPAASYGNYAILWQLAQARRWGLPYLHLGYWVAGSAKMQYKARFQPCEILLDGHWQPPPAAARQPMGRQAPKI